MLEIGADVVTKRYPGNRDGAEREWRSLLLLAEWAPGLAPTPLTADLAGDPPEIRMSRLNGTSLGNAPVTDEQVAAMAAAVTRLHTSIPRGPISAFPQRPGHPLEMANWLREQCGAHPGLGADPVVARAFAAAVEWLSAETLDKVLQDEPEPVFGSGDGNLANFLWDGSQVQLIDFEYGGRCDRAYDLAEIVEHISMSVEAGSLLAHFELSGSSALRLRRFRRLLALYWFLRVLPGNADPGRIAPGTAERQAARLLELLS